MTERLKTILAEYRKGLEALYGPRLKEVILYGSQARGDAGPESDIDVMVVVHGPLNHGQEIERTSALTADLSLRHHVVIARQFATPRQIEAREFKLYRAVARDGIRV